MAGHARVAMVMGTPLMPTAVVVRMRLLLLQVRAQALGRTSLPLGPSPPGHTAAASQHTQELVLLPPVLVVLVGPLQGQQVCPTGH